MGKENTNTVDIVQAIYGKCDVSPNTIIVTSLSSLEGRRGYSSTRSLSRAWRRETEVQKPNDPKVFKLSASLTMRRLVTFHQELDQAMQNFDSLNRDTENPLSCINSISQNEALAAHCDTLLSGVQAKEQVAIESCLGLNHFLLWLAENGNSFHFGPRRIGKLRLKLPNQPTLIIDGGEIDNLILVPKMVLGSQEERELLALHELGRSESRKTGVAATYILRLLEARDLGEALILEFKLGSPDSYPQTKRLYHQRQLSNSLGLTASILNSPQDQMDQPWLIRPKESRIIVRGQLIYFGPEGVTLTTHESGELQIDPEIVKRTITRESTSLLVDSRSDPVGMQIEAVRSAREAHSREIERIFRLHLRDHPSLAWQLVGDLKDPLHPTSEIINRSISSGQISLRDLVITAGHIDIVWIYKDGTLLIPLYDVGLESSDDTDNLLMIPPNRSTAYVLRSRLKKEIAAEMIIVDSQGNPINPNLITPAIQRAIRLARDFETVPFTFQEFEGRLIEDRLDALLLTYQTNLLHGDNKHCRNARRYIQSRGIPLAFASRCKIGCTSSWQTDLAKNGLYGPNNRELRLHLGISSGNIWEREWPILSAGIVTAPVYDSWALISHNQLRHVGFTGRTIYPKMQPSHRVALDHDRRREPWEYKAIFGNLLASKTLVLTEGIFDGLSAAYILDMSGNLFGKASVLINVGLRKPYFLSDLQERGYAHRLVNAFDQDQAAEKISIAHSISFWDIVRDQLGTIPGDVKDVNDLLLRLLEQPEELRKVGRAILRI